MATPLGMVQQTSLSTKGVSSGLQRTVWDKRIELESLQMDPFFSLTGSNADFMMRTVPVGPNQKIKLPNGIIADFTPSDKEGKAARNITTTFKRALQGTGRFGDSEGQIGYEENYRLKLS